MNVDDLIQINRIVKKLYSEHPPYSINQEEVDYLIQLGIVIDISKGGLLLGHSHDQGGVMVLSKKGEEYILTTCIEGWEFVMSPEASKADAESEDGYFKDLNEAYFDDEDEPFEPYEIPENTRLIDATPIPFKNIHIKKLLLSPERQMVINKWATRATLKWINMINERSLGVG